MGWGFEIPQSPGALEPCEQYGMGFCILSFTRDHELTHITFTKGGGVGWGGGSGGPASCSFFGFIILSFLWRRILRSKLWLIPPPLARLGNLKLYFFLSGLHLRVWHTQLLSHICARSVQLSPHTNHAYVGLNDQNSRVHMTRETFCSSHEANVYSTKKVVIG